MIPDRFKPSFIQPDYVEEYERTLVRNAESNLKYVVICVARSCAVRITKLVESKKAVLTDDEIRRCFLEEHEEIGREAKRNRFDHKNIEVNLAVQEEDKLLSPEVIADYRTHYKDKVFEILESVLPHYYRVAPDIEPFRDETAAKLKMMRAEESPLADLARFVANPNPSVEDSPYAVDSLVMATERCMNLVPDAFEPGIRKNFSTLTKQAYRAICEKQFEKRILTGRNTLATVDYALRRAEEMGADVNDLFRAFHTQPTHVQEEANKTDATETMVIPMEGHASSGTKGSAQRKHSLIVG